MNIHSWLADASSLLWPRAANHLWQATLFLLLAFLVNVALRRGPARGRYAVLLLAALKFALPSAALLFIASRIGLDLQALFAHQTAATTPVFSQITEPVSRFTTGFPIASETGSGHSEVYCVFSALWAVGFAAVVLVWWWRRRSLSLVIKNAREIPEGREAAALSQVRNTLGVTRAIKLVFVDRALEPGVWGVLRPVLVMPERFCQHLDEAELEAVMMHEVIHVKRWDNLISNLHMALCSVLWFHPLVWVLDRKLLAERERVCDEGVISLNVASEVYASSILKVCRLCSGHEVPGLSCAAGPSLRRRIEEIMANSFRRTLSAFQRVLIALAVSSLVVMSVGAVVLSRDGSGFQGTRNRDQGSSAANPGVRGGVPGGVVGGVPGGVEGGVSAGVPGGTPGGVIGSVAGFDAADQEKVADLLKGLDDAPDIPIEFKNQDGTPLSIASASVKAVKTGVVYKQGKRGDSVRETSDMYMLRPAIVFVNNTAKRIIGVGVEFNNKETRSVNFIGRVKLVIEPYGSVNAGSDTVFLAPLPGDPSQTVVRLSGVLFEGGGQWGTFLPPPPPPPPPMAPPPPASDQPPSGPGAPPRPPSGDGPPLVIRKSGALLQETAIRKVEPTYPPQAKAARISGSVVVEVMINEDGKVESARAVSGHPLLKGAAVDAAQGWKFKPTRLEGKTVKVIGTLTFNFQT